jgi:hypothetical protein
LTLTEFFFSNNQAGTATTTAKLKRTTPNKSEKSLPHRGAYENSIPWRRNATMNSIETEISVTNDIIWKIVFSCVFCIIKN